MTAPTQPRIAIVGMGGLFRPWPGPPTRTASGPTCWPPRPACAPLPPGRWLLDPDEIFDPTIGAPRISVYSRRGYFLDDIPCPNRRARLPRGSSTTWIPLFHLTLYAGRQALASGREHNGLDRRRAASSSATSFCRPKRRPTLARNVLGGTFAGAVPEAVPPACHAASALDRHVVGLPAPCWAGTSAWVAAVTPLTRLCIVPLCTATRRRRVAVPAGPTPCWPAAFRGRIACTRRWASRNCGRCRSVGPVPSRSMRGPTAWSSARGPAFFY